MKLGDRSSFQRKFVVYNGLTDAGTLFKSNRKCLKYSLPDLSGLQMRLSSDRKELKTKLRADDVLLDRNNTFVSTSCEVKAISHINLNNDNLKLSTISLFPSVASTEDFKNNIKKSFKKSLRTKQKPFGATLQTSQSMPSLSYGEIDRLMEEVLICSKPPLINHDVSNKLTCEKPVG